MSSVVGLGFACVDHICLVPRIPGTDEKVHISQLIKQGGGVAGTAIVTAARLGAQASIIWCIGSDDDGRFVTSEFKRDGVDMRHLIVAPDLTTACAYVLVEESSGKRTIASYYDANTLVKLAKMDFDWVKDAGALYIDGVHEASIKAASFAKDNRIPVICGTAEYAPEYQRAFKLVDVFIASLDWARSLTDEPEPVEAARKILRAGPRVVVVTIGDKGSICVTEDEIIRKRAFCVNVVDTTGAGDVYSGAFTYGFLREWPLSFVAEFSNAVAAIKCEKLGGRAGIPTLSRVKTFLKERGIEAPDLAGEYSN